MIINFILNHTNEVVNDSDESSFNFHGRYDNESIIESIKRFE